MSASAGITFRKASHDDLDAIVHIAQSLVVPMMNQSGNYQWNNTYPLRTDFLEDVDNDQLWIAEDEGEIAGFAALTTDQSPEYADVGWDLSVRSIVPHRLAVHPKYRGKNIAVEFMLIAEQLAKEGECRYVRVDTNEVNLAMQGVFRKLGYNHCGNIRFLKEPKEIYADLVFYCYQKQVTG